MFGKLHKTLDSGVSLLYMLYMLVLLVSVVIHIYMQIGAICYSRLVTIHWLSGPTHPKFYIS